MSEQIELEANSEEAHSTSEQIELEENSESAKNTHIEHSKPTEKFRFSNLSDGVQCGIIFIGILLVAIIVVAIGSTCYGINYAVNHKTYNMTTGCPLNNPQCENSQKIICYNNSPGGCAAIGMWGLLIFTTISSITSVLVILVTTD